MTLVGWVWLAVGLATTAAIIGAFVYFTPKLRLFGQRALRLEAVLSELDQLPREPLEDLPKSQLGDDPVIHVQRRLKLLHQREVAKQQRRRRLVSRITNRLEN